MKENEKEKLEKLTAEFEAHPMTQALRAEKAAEALAKRKAAVARIEDLRLNLEATRIIQKDIDDLNFKLAVVDAEREEIQANIAKKGTQNPPFLAKVTVRFRPPAPNKNKGLRTLRQPASLFLFSSSCPFYRYFTAFGFYPTKKGQGESPRPLSSLLRIPIAF